MDMVFKMKKTVNLYAFRELHSDELIGIATDENGEKILCCSNGTNKRELKNNFLKDIGKKSNLSDCQINFMF